MGAVRHGSICPYICTALTHVLSYLGCALTSPLCSHFQSQRSGTWRIIVCPAWHKWLSSPCAASRFAIHLAVRPRDIGSILKLVNLALTRVPSMFAADNRHVLTEVSSVPGSRQLHH